MVSFLPKSALGNIVIGAAAAVVGPTVLKPVAVGAVRVGYGVKDFATSTWNSAKKQALQIRDEAKAAHNQASMEAEIQQLRAEVNALKARKQA